MTNPTARPAVMRILKAGTMIRGESFDRAFPLETVQSYAGRYSEDQQAAFDRAVAKGHETAWVCNGGTSITNEPWLVKLAKQNKENADWAAAIIVRTGDVCMVEGIPQVCRVNGQRFSDAIVFRPL